MLTHIAKSEPAIDEDTITTALGFILNRHPEAGQAINDLVRQAGATNLKDSKSFTTQWTLKDQSRPDLVAFDDKGRISILMELKFQAPLQPTQPQAYIKALIENQPSALLFIAPLTRMPRLAEELRRRSNLKDHHNTQHFYGAHILGTDHILVLASWEGIFRRLTQAAHAANDPHFLKNVEELQELAAGLTTLQSSLLDLEAIPTNAKKQHPEPTHRKPNRKTKPNQQMPFAQQD